ncbi:hypothetical protein JOE11_004087 [Robbsia andropogonis]
MRPARTTGATPVPAPARLPGMAHDADSGAGLAAVTTPSSATRRLPC